MSDVNPKSEQQRCYRCQCGAYLALNRQPLEPQPAEGERLEVLTLGISGCYACRVEAGP